MDNNEFWREVLGRIQNEVSDRDFISFFKDIELKEKSDTHILIEFPSSFAKEWINDNHSDIFSRVASALNGSKLSVKNSISNKKKPFVKKNNVVAPIRPSLPDCLKPEFTFENFVVGPPNQFSHAAAQAVAKQPGISYNPLFIYSVPGLGKTHLLNAIGNFIKKESPDYNICYITSEDFTNEMVDCLLAGKPKMADFRNKYRQVDVLLIDDIQFIGGKESTEEEFFHTFNTLEKNQKQIVMTSDRLPNDIPKLESRLRSRFQMGLIADIQPPDKETLVAILITKAKQENIPLKKDVAFFLAEHLSNLDIRRIIGTLNRIALHASFKELEIIDIAFAKKTLEELNILSLNEINVSIEEIIKRVADHFKISSKDLLSKKKTKNIVFPRQIAMSLARTITQESFPEIGNKFGGKDHATVMHACKKIEKEITLDRKTATLIEGLKEKILSP
ncbi:MAG TPA: chromosomal replication initiator protein DnaA [Proteobacteria bacterium]|nr:chromosomal replication initiator protein DnaA [Pseudomonadota bacterium]